MSNPVQNKLDSLVAIIKQRESEIDRLLERNDWISISDRLPEENTNVIVDGGLAYFRQGVWMTITGERFPGKPIQWKVTHWQPLPELKNDPD